MSQVRRITLFKIPSESDITAVLKAYDILKATNKKVRPSACSPSFPSFTPFFPSPPFLFPHLTLFPQDGAPYILSCDAARVYNTSEERSQGYTVAVQSTFASKVDVEFYDKECAAHKELKKLTTAVHQGLCTLLMEDGSAGVKL
jgi:Stress responsive A/B Barrel Domain